MAGFPVTYQAQRGKLAPFSLLSGFMTGRDRLEVMRETGKLQKWELHHSKNRAYTGGICWRTYGVYLKC